MGERGKVKEERGKTFRFDALKKTGVIDRI
jgi:hypothetical protein